MKNVLKGKTRCKADYMNFYQQTKLSYFMLKIVNY